MIKITAETKPAEDEYIMACCIASAVERRARSLYRIPSGKATRCIAVCALVGVRLSNRVPPRKNGYDALSASGAESHRGFKTDT